MGISLGADSDCNQCVGGTKLGTRLLNGFNSTTVNTAYFALPAAPLESLNQRAYAEFLASMVPAIRAHCF